MRQRNLYPAQSAMWSNPLAKGLLVGKGKRGVVWMPSAYDEKKRYPFRPLQLRFLHALASGEPLQDILQKLQMTEEEVMKLMKRRKCHEYLAELESMDAEIVGRTTVDRLTRDLLDVWDGKKVKDREQMEAMKEILARKYPRPEKSTSHAENIQININIGKIEEAEKRQLAIEAEIVRDEKPS